MIYKLLGLFMLLVALCFAALPVLLSYLVVLDDYKRTKRGQQA